MRGGGEIAPLPVPAVSAVGVAPLRVQARSRYFGPCVDPRAVDSSGAAGDWLASQWLPLRWFPVCEALQDVP